MFGGAPERGECRPDRVSGFDEPRLPAGEDRGSRAEGECAQPAHLAPEAHPLKPRRHPPGPLAAHGRRPHSGRPHLRTSARSGARPHHGQGFASDRSSPSNGRDPRQSADRHQQPSKRFPQQASPQSAAFRSDGVPHRARLGTNPGGRHWGCTAAATARRRSHAIGRPSRESGRPHGCPDDSLVFQRPLERAGGCRMLLCDVRTGCGPGRRLPHGVGRGRRTLPGVPVKAPTTASLSLLSPTSRSGPAGVTR